MNVQQSDSGEVAPGEVACLSPSARYLDVASPTETAVVTAISVL